MSEIKIGIIGGSGLYELPNVKIVEEREIETPFGKPSDKYTIIDVDGIKAVFLPRHGKGHRITPSELPVRANIWGFKSMGVDRLIAISAVGSLTEKVAPEHFLLPDQIIDRTKGRDSSFFDHGVVAHISFAEPFCKKLTEKIKEPLRKELGSNLHEGGTYLCMEGPAFSTRAESNMYRSWGASVIGMTAIPEAKLAREAEMCYSLIAMSTDYDCWKIEEDAVTVEMVIAHMVNNTNLVKKCLPEIIKKASEHNDCEHHHALAGAIITNKEAIPVEIKKKCEVIAGKYF